MNKEIEEWRQSAINQDRPYGIAPTSYNNAKLICLMRWEQLHVDSCQVSSCVVYRGMFRVCLLNSDKDPIRSLEIKCKIESGNIVPVGSMSKYEKNVFTIQVGQIPAAMGNDVNRPGVKRGGVTFEVVSDGQETVSVRSSKWKGYACSDCDVFVGGDSDRAVARSINANVDEIGARLNELRRMAAVIPESRALDRVNKLRDLIVEIGQDSRECILKVVCSKKYQEERSVDTMIDMIWACVDV